MSTELEGMEPASETRSVARVHTPVMLREVLEALAPRSGCVYADATAGAAGHSRAILEASAPDGRLIAIDRDPFAVQMASAALADFGRARSSCTAIMRTRADPSPRGAERCMASSRTWASARRSSTAPSAAFRSRAAGRSTCA